MRKNRAAKLLGAIVGLLALGAGWVALDRGASAHAPEGQTHGVQRTRLALSVQEVGVIEPFRKVDLKSKVAGQVAEVLVDVGQRVRAGDVLVRLDPRDIRRELQLADARHRVNEAAFNQANELLGIQSRALSRGGIAEVEVTKSRGDVERLRAQFQLDAAEASILRDRLGYTELRSPIDGVVLARNIQPGEMVTPGVSAMVDGRPLLVVAQVETLLVRTELNQVDVVRLEPQQKVAVKVDAVPGRVFEGKVYRIAAMAQRSERRKESGLLVYPVDIQVDAAQIGGEALRPGMLADVTVTLGARENVLAIPLETVVREGDKTRVWVVDAAGKETLQDVELGAQNDSLVEVVAGLEEGARVRVHPAREEK